MNVITATVIHQDGSFKDERIDRIVSVEGSGLLGKIVNSNYNVALIYGNPRTDGMWVALSSSERFNFETEKPVAVAGFDNARSIHDRKLVPGGIVATMNKRHVYRAEGTDFYTTNVPLAALNAAR